MVSLAGRAVHVTDIEIRMLLELSVSAGRVIAHAQLFNGLEYGTLRGSGAVRTFAKNVGKKLRDYANKVIRILKRAHRRLLDVQERNRGTGGLVDQPLPGPTLARPRALVGKNSLPISRTVSATLHIGPPDGAESSYSI